MKKQIHVTSLLDNDDVNRSGCQKSIDGRELLLAHFPSLRVAHFSARLASFPLKR